MRYDRTHEASGSITHQSDTAGETIVRMRRPMRPPKLNCLKTPTPDHEPIFETTDDLPKWRKGHHRFLDPEYVFVSYLHTQFTSGKDWQYLYTLAENAALSAGMGAFWLDRKFYHHPTNPQSLISK